MNEQKYVIKVKNNLGKNKEITLINGDKYILKDKDEKIIGFYSDDARPIIFKLLKAGFEVSKMLEEHVQDYMKIETVSNDVKTDSSNLKENDNKSNSLIEEKPKKKRGRPPKNK